MDDTIVAIGSPPGGAARGIVRLTGPGVAPCVEAVFCARGAGSLVSLKRPAVLPGDLAIPGLHSRLPCDLYYWPGPRSYTGQPVAEVHTLGSWPLLEAAVRALCAAGARLAEPGEFTLRAFLAGRMDLTQAEAVLGVVDAVSAAELEVALAQLAGGLAHPLWRLRGELLDLLAHLEAGLDFADEDVPFITPQQLHAELAEARATVEALLAQMAQRASGPRLAHVVLVGWPNTGKSSLFNALVGRRAALVSDHPGTTRDYLTAELDYGGVRCVLVDTAGVEPQPSVGADALVQAAQAATAQQVGSAQVELFCLDSTRAMNAWERSQVRETRPNRLMVLTKTDAPTHTDFGGPAIRTSALRRTGLDGLREAIGRAVVELGGQRPGAVAGTALRCHESLRVAAECLTRAMDLACPATAEELVAAELRVALDELGKVAGAVYTEDVLDRIFSRFCVGK